jgi:hypothetical protein
MRTFAIRLLETSLKEIRANRFFKAQKEENAFEWRFDIMKPIHDVTKVTF